MLANEADQRMLLSFSADLVLTDPAKGRVRVSVGKRCVVMLFLVLTWC